jgi:hypothetical protein
MAQLQHTFNAAHESAGADASSKVQGPCHRHFHSGKLERTPNTETVSLLERTMLVSNRSLEGADMNPTICLPISWINVSGGIALRGCTSAAHYNLESHAVLPGYSDTGAPNAILHDANVVKSSLLFASPAAAPDSCLAISAECKHSTANLGCTLECTLTPRLFYRTTQSNQTMPRPYYLLRSFNKLLHTPCRSGRTSGPAP